MGQILSWIRVLILIQRFKSCMCFLSDFHGLVKFAPRSQQSQEGAVCMLPNEITLAVFFGRWRAFPRGNSLPACSGYIEVIFMFTPRTFSSPRRRVVIRLFKPAQVQPVFRRVYHFP